MHLGREGEFRMCFGDKMKKLNHLNACWFWGGLFGVICPPWCPGHGHSQSLSPSLGGSWKCVQMAKFRSAPSFYRWRCRGPGTANELARCVGALQNPERNLTSWLHSLSPTPSCLSCPPSLGLTRAPWRSLVTLLPALGIHEFWFGVKLMVYTSYSTH